MISTVTSIILGLSFSLAAAEKEPAPPMPPVAVRDKGAEWGPRKWTWEGVTIVLDPVNKETLYLCGRVGGAAFGTIGSWALAADGKTWRQMAVRSEILDPLAMKCVFSSLAASRASTALISIAPRRSCRRFISSNEAAVYVSG